MSQLYPWPYDVPVPVPPVNLYTEPADIRRGADLKFFRALSLYPASGGWTLRYSLRGGGSKIDFVSVPSAPGSDTHLLAVAAADTEQWKEGEYEGQGLAVNATETHEIWHGFIKVLPDLASAEANYDPRSHNQKMLDALEATLEGKATDDILSTQIEGTLIQRMTFKELLAARDYYKAAVRGEKAQARADAGNSTGRRILTRFRRPI